MCPDLSQALKEVNISIYRRKKKNDRFFFLASRFQVLQGMFVQIFAQIFEELTA